MTGAGCVFCKIGNGTAPAEIVGENERTIALMDINPVTDGHVLVISRSHARDIWDLEPEDGRAVWSLTRAIGDVIRAGLEPHGLTLFQGNETAGWQDGFRFRLHLVPRWLGDGLVKPWQPTDSRRAGIASAAARIRSARPG